MSPLYTDEQKADAVAKFIYYRANKKATIADYSAIKDYLNSGSVKPLCSLSKSGTELDRFYNAIGKIYTNGDAVKYVEWLISAISGTLETAVSEDIYKKAVNQLFMFLFNLSGALKADVDLLGAWQVDHVLYEKLDSYDKSILSLKSDMNIARMKIKSTEAQVDRMNEKITTALDRILQWQKTYQPHLDELKQEHDERDKLTRGAGLGGQKGKP